MEVQIGKYKISTDKYNFVLEEEITPKRKRSESGGQPYWVTLGYYPTLELACHNLMKCDIKDTDASDLEGVVTHITDSTEAITEAVKKLKEVPTLSIADR